MQPKINLKKYKLLGIGMIPIMITVFTVALIIIGIYEWL